MCKGHELQVNEPLSKINICPGEGKEGLHAESWKPGVHSGEGGYYQSVWVHGPQHVADNGAAL